MRVLDGTSLGQSEEILRRTSYVIRVYRVDEKQLKHISTHTCKFGRPLSLLRSIRKQDHIINKMVPGHKYTARLYKKRDGYIKRASRNKYFYMSASQGLVTWG